MEERFESGFDRLSDEHDEFEEDSMLVGMKQIGEYCGGISRNTIKRWVKYRGFPACVHGGTWVASRKRIKEWAMGLMEARTAESMDENDGYRY